MSKETYIEVSKLCLHYNADLTFFSNLNDYGLIEIVTIEQSQYILQDKIPELEKMIRIHDELNVNIEGIDVIINLLQKIDDLQTDLNSIKNRLKIYED